MKYNWKIPSFAKGIDPDLVVQEFEEIEKDLGSLTAENILKRAALNNSTLHSLFEWDDTAAAIEYRKSQARQIVNNIQVSVLSNGELKKIDVFEIVIRDNNKSYKHVNDFTVQTLINLKERTLKELLILKNKLSFYDQFRTVVPKIQELTDMLKAV